MTKEHGPVSNEKCQNCNNESAWQLLRISTWATFFFIPIFPYNYQRLYLCPVCGHGVELQKEQYEEMVPIADANLQLVEGKISEQEHERLMFEQRKRIE